MEELGVEDDRKKSKERQLAVAGRSYFRLKSGHSLTAETTGGALLGLHGSSQRLTMVKGKERWWSTKGFMEERREERGWRGKKRKRYRERERKRKKIKVIGKNSRIYNVQENSRKNFD